MITINDTNVWIYYCQALGSLKSSKLLLSILREHVN